MVSIGSEPLDVAAVLAGLGTPESGGLDIFLGIVRNYSGGKRVRHLEYTAYVPMAEKLMSEIEQDIRARWPVHRIVIKHRIGTLRVGEVAVITAVSAAHRDAAFEACRVAIDRVKAEVPIWKKEVFEEEETADRETTAASRSATSRHGSSQ